ncbi:MAG: hypothetical protein IJL87_02405 [Clostridia bacterium]|nr:hypothetical protein [Clostridia bacterium]
MFENVNFQFPIVEYIAKFWLIFGFFGIPVLVTIFNIYNLCSPKKILDKFFEFITLAAGVLYSGVLYTYYVPNLTAGSMPVVDKFMPAIQTVGGVALVAFLIVWIFGSKLNGVQTTICYGGIYLGILLALMFVLQLVPCVSDLCKNFGEGVLMILFPINFVVMSLSMFIKNSAALTIKNAESNDIRFFDILGVRFLFGILFGVAILAIIVGVLYLFKYPYDSLLRAFTDAGPEYLFHGRFGL